MNALFALVLFPLWFIIIPITGSILLPLLTPYFLKRKLYKDIKPFPSFIPFWLTAILLVFIMNNIWTNYFNGKIFYEWDTGFVQYSLLHYESPIIFEPNVSWIAKGWSLFDLYLFWAATTAGIYVVATGIALLANRGEENFLQYKRVLIKGSFVMFVIGLLVAAFLNLIIKS